jgi:hypothetical protein
MVFRPNSGRASWRIGPGLTRRHFLLLASVSAGAAVVRPALAASPYLVEPDAASLTPPTVLPRSEWDPHGWYPPHVDAPTTPTRLHLHHTHIPVVHAPEEVPEALREIARFHRQTRGFSDIGYHYLIDPYGRIWQGRGPVLSATSRGAIIEGAHAQGFNRDSIGIALIGDFDGAPPSLEALTATVELTGWLAFAHGLDTTSTTEAVSTGGSLSRYASSETVRLPVLLGHKDTALETACPGAHLYALLPDLRAAAQHRADTLREHRRQQWQARWQRLLDSGRIAASP